jgi:hypothetical protein
MSEPAKHAPTLGLDEPPNLEDPAVLRRLHREASSSVDPEIRAGALYGVGFVQGMIDGLRTAQSFNELSPSGTSLRAPRIPMLLPLERTAAEQRGVGRLLHSSEASDHLRHSGRAAHPVCHVGAGYAGGWYSALRRETWLVREVECVACGDELCRFEARRVPDWFERDEAWTRTLVPFLDFDLVTERIAAEPEETLELTAAGDLLGGIEPMSPAVYVWGPVLVLPYGGAEEGESALDAVRADPDGEEIRVVIVDVVGARVDGAAALGLAGLVSRLSRRGLEVIVAGRRTDARLPALAEGLETRDVSSGIALAFQLCGG